MRNATKAFLIGCVTALVGCGLQDDIRPASCDYEALYACVVVLPGVHIDREHVERQLAMACAYWHAPENVLAGWAIVYFPEELTCNGGRASGCTYVNYRIRTIQVQALDPDCAETAQLVHEVGHTVVGDTWHEGPCWDYDREQRATCHVVRDPGASPGCADCAFYPTPCE